MKKLIALSVLFLFIVLINPISNADIDVDISEENSCMVAPHDFKLSVVNNQSFVDYFHVNVDDHSSWVWINTRTLRIEPGQTGTAEISVRPLRSAEMGKYTSTVTIYSNTNRSVEQQKELCFIVFRNYTLNTDNFQLNAENFEPGETIRSTIDVTNDGSKKFDNISYNTSLLREDQIIKTVSSDTDLDIDERKELSNSIKLDQYQTPGDYLLSYSVKAKGHVFDAGQIDLTVNEVSDIVQEESYHSGILMLTNQIVVKNNGNHEFDDYVTKNVDFPNSLLVTAKNAEVVSTDTGNEYRWNLNILPGEEKVVTYQVNVWPIYVILIILAFVVYRLINFLRIPTIKKKVRRTEFEEGNRVYTVTLEVSNRLFGKAKNVIVTDLAPSVTRVVEDFQGMKPDLKKSDKGTSLRWDLGYIGSGEERVLHYKVKTLVEAVDHLKLPKATITGQVGKSHFERNSSKVKLEV